MLYDDAGAVFRLFMSKKFNQCNIYKVSQDLTKAVGKASVVY